MDKSSTKIKRHDGHPQKHRYGGKVTNITKKLTDRIICKFEIVYYEEQSCEKEVTDNIAQYNLPMEIIEVGKDPVYKEDNAQGYKTDTTKDSENHHQ